jgi:SAM-dependent methyltransferase
LFKKIIRSTLPQPVRRRGWIVLTFLKAQWTIMRANILQLFERHPGPVPMPPPRLRFRVSGGAVAKDFLKSGARSAADLRAALRKVDQTCALYGTDIDDKAIEWCQEKLDFATFETNGALPPLPFPDGKFDLIYSISIFTHLDEEYQMAWLAELKRVLRPGGIALLTFHSDINWRDLTPEELTGLQERGFYYKVSITGRLKPDGLPDFYQSAYHTERYVVETCGRFLEIRAFIEKGLENYQSIAVLEKKRS